MILKCDCCGITRDFGDPEDAFNAGWDSVPHFFGYVACDLCPAAYQFHRDGWAHHQPIHDKWAREGRPTEWDPETCIEEGERPTPEQMEMVKKFIDSIDKDELEQQVAAIRKTFEENDAAVDEFFAQGNDQ